ncbi:DUF1206 domain-containing protein [Microbacterium sp. CFBP9023]|uniref:DUF1206 domain-containing protein n=1 Tax=unclassified Microbacterium TaxID=2609290 RepID=UPI00069D1BE9|nr:MULTISPECIES: DUF1206 domain-containing protein [unclassified Microbacterium]AKV87546.1 hypothetical protein AKG07_15945 [Microbacterium sp. CGR1]KRD54299.1 hypothetical protein ASE34_04315 [Microbacterium sp. Root280D1]MDY0985222.1 DUF1206 domain-containing protein [Microbacterium sp. CFBP9023]CAH0227213.1 hypothetical protein SRABI98_02651 [Microbacterium sp. Bi98]
MTSAKGAARTAQRSDAFRRVARAGFVVIGLVHIIIGAIAVSIASGGGGDADQDGAMEQIRSTPVGGLVLGVIAVALIALAVWQVASGLLTGGKETRKWGMRIKLIGIAGAYLVIAGLALIFAFGGHVESEDTSRALSAVVLSAPGGIVALILLGLTVAGVGIGFIVIGFTRGFEKTMDVPTGPSRPGIIALGVAGYIAKGIAIAVTGALFVVAAWTQDPQKAAGLDAALRSLVDLPLGRAILWLVGVGLAIYGVFSMVRARFARM